MHGEIFVVVARGAARLLRGLVLASLGGAAAFAGAAEERRAESIQAFLDAAKVMQHPRCSNCHTGGEAPKQGDNRTPHALGVKRGPNDRGAPGLGCNVCHQDRNIAGIPGASDWHLAPLAMGWGELSAGEICRTITDTSKNGNRLPKGVVLHVENDSLVVWAWDPGGGRTKPPGTHADFVKLMARWAETGGACPD